MKPRVFSSCRKSDFDVLMGCAAGLRSAAVAASYHKPGHDRKSKDLSCRLFLLLALAEPLVEIGVNHLHQSVHAALEEMIRVRHGRVIDDDALLRLETIDEPAHGL